MSETKEQSNEKNHASLTETYNDPALGDPGEWTTPQDFFNKLHAEFNFVLDVASTKTNAKCPNFLTKEDDALTCPWLKPAHVTGDYSFWMNPPYGYNITNKWVKKAWEESKYHRIVCLLPAKTETKWWAIFWDHDRHEPRPGVVGKVRFIKGRIKFNNLRGSGWFPSIIVVFDRRGLQ